MWRFQKSGFFDPSLGVAHLCSHRAFRKVIPQGIVMSDPIFSPDGKFMWTGSEWIPAPPKPTQSANLNVQDSVVTGDVNVIQNTTVVNENKASQTCPNCGTVGSVLLACTRGKIPCKKIDFCLICSDRVLYSRLHKIGKLEDSFWSGHIRDLGSRIWCNSCWTDWSTTVFN